jgi:ATP-dependent Lhr-like helicase
MARAAGAFCVLDGGELVLYLERGGRSLTTRGEVRIGHLRALLEVAVRAGKLELQRVDGLPVAESKYQSLLREAGFASSHRGLVVYPRRG